MKPSRKVQLTVIEDRTLLRPPGMEDEQGIYEAVRASIAELSPWMAWCNEDYSIDITRDWLEALPSQWEQGTNYQFGIFDVRNAEFLGVCGLNHFNWQYHLANLGYWVRSDRTGEGVATGAARRVAQFGLEALGLARIEIVIAINNAASRRVAEKAGARFEGILRSRIRLGERSVDAAMHSLISEDFQGP